MRHWADMLALYKLEHGSYKNAQGSHPTAEEVGASWPNDWLGSDPNGLEDYNNLWYCFANEELTGMVYCSSQWKSDDENFEIMITQPDDSYYPAGKRLCSDNESFCKALGGKKINGYSTNYYEF